MVETNILLCIFFDKWQYNLALEMIQLIVQHLEDSMRRNSRDTQSQSKCIIFSYEMGMKGLFL